MGTSVVSHIRIDNRRDPLTRLASADENASSSHPLPQGGEGRVELAPSPPWGRGWTAAGVLTSRGGTGEGVRALSHCQINRGTPHWLTPDFLDQGAFMRAMVVSKRAPVETSP